jgi:hypothetical protein
MKIDEAQGKTYPGYGVCIYCGSEGGVDGLRDEHVVPFSLNGNCVIKDACCVTCQNKINPADTYLGKTVFYHLRLHINAQTRNPRNRPKTLKTRISIGTNETSVVLPSDRSPFSLALPIWGEPGVFRGAPIDAPFPSLHTNMYHFVPQDIHDVLDIEDDTEYRIWATQKISPYLFARAVAKIAYCYMVLHHGLGTFRPLLLPRVITGESSAAAPYFIGSPIILPPPPTKDIIHDVKLGIFSLGLMRLYISQVRLFSYSGYKEYGMPIYTVITGAP